MRLQAVQHVPYEGPGAIAEWAAQRGHSFELVDASAAAFPSPEDYDMLIVLGGPMGVRDVDRYGWLASEKMALDAALGGDPLVLGICLGAQLIAEALGAQVRRAPYREIGWYPVELTQEAARSAPFRAMPRRFVAFHWHGDVFDIPDGASHTAESRAFANQAFSWDGGRVVALQFHLEATNESVREMVAHGREQLAASRWVQPAAGVVAGEERWGASARHLLFELLDNMERVAAARPRRPRPVHASEATGAGTGGDAGEGADEEPPGGGDERPSGGDGMP